MTTQQVDLLRWTMGEVESVSVSYSFHRLLRNEADLTIPDSQTVLCASPRALLPPSAPPAPSAEAG